MLDAIGLPELVARKKVCIKMHMGAKFAKSSFTTIHPFFVRLLVDKVKEAGAADVFVTDEKIDGCEVRGYTEQTFGCRIVNLFPEGGEPRIMEIGFKTFDTAEVGADLLDADVLIDFSHVKGHGACGLGAAVKNIAMGCVSDNTRPKMHALEGGIVWDPEKCTRCLACVEGCDRHAVHYNEEEDKIEFFFHNCKYCRHCVLSCTEGALTTTEVSYEDFQEAMARVTEKILEKFGPDNVLFINMLMNITIFCDCWGISTPPIVPDLGILASKDIVAIDQASLDLIKVENLLESGLPDGWELVEGTHLFEKIHAKNPFVVLQFLEQLGVGNSQYQLQEIE
ncbi:MAG TPA: DUF362 domain-containing protein [Candidatus Lokiarchaeia archaeon]|nr:DUF362 domain-containing protein [Candidatus Lokiarchaeia archaeon]